MLQFPYEIGGGDFNTVGLPQNLEGIVNKGWL